MKQSNMQLNYGYERLLYNDKRVPQYFNHGDSIIEIRNLKLRLINENIDYKINYNYLNSIEKILEVTNSNYKDYIFTGSIALNIYGLINRNYKDIDIILPKDFNINDDGTFNQVTHYPSGDDSDFCSKRMGYKDVRPKISLSKSSIKDIFSTIFSSDNNIRYDIYHDEDNKVKYNTFRYEGESYRIQDVCQLMEQKNVLLQRYTPIGNFGIANEHYYKHYYDMNFIYNNLTFKDIK